MEPASIRYRNPGAMWGGNPVSKKWGEMGNVALNDGTGQGNHIAVFPTYVAGICAQIDLWRGPRYRNKPFASAIAVWSGGNSVESYIKFVLDRVPGMQRGTIINDALLSSDLGVKFLQAQAWHEAGKPYPAPASDWIDAQKRVFSGVQPKPKSTVKQAAPIIVGTVAASAASTMGLDAMTYLLAFAVGFAACWFGKQIILDKVAQYRAKV